MTSIFIQKGDRGFIYSKIMRIWRRKKVDDTGCIGRNHNVLCASDHLVGVTGTFKPRIFDRVEFIEKTVLSLTD